MNCWARYLLYLVIAALAIGQMLAACGQKGPLYLPDSDLAGASEGASQGSPIPDPDSSDEGLEALDDVPTVAPEPASL